MLVVEEVVFTFRGSVAVVLGAIDEFDEGSMIIANVLTDVTVTTDGLVAVVLPTGEVD